VLERSYQKATHHQIKPKTVPPGQKKIVNEEGLFNCKKEKKGIKTTILKKRKNIAF